MAYRASGVPHTLQSSISRSITARSTRLRVTAVAEKQKRQIKKKVGSTAKSISQAGPVQRLKDANEQLQEGGVSIKKLLTQALIVGVTFGTVFQVTHNNGLLPVGRPASPHNVPYE